MAAAKELGSFSKEEPFVGVCVIEIIVYWGALELWKFLFEVNYPHVYGELKAFLQWQFNSSSLSAPQKFAKQWPNTPKRAQQVFMLATVDAQVTATQYRSPTHGKMLSTQLQEASSLQSSFLSLQR